jgi:hypothetical protein
MKKSIFAILGMCLALSVSAQGIGRQKLKSGHGSEKDRTRVDAVLQKQAATTAASKTTALKKRLIASAYSQNGILVDTNRYYYSGYRGSTHPNLYSYVDLYVPQANRNFFGGNLTDQQFIKSDSSINWRTDSQGDLIMTRKKTYAYNTGNKVVSSLDSLEAWYYIRNDLTYDAMGRLTSYIAYDTFGGTQFIPKYTVFIKYDLAGRRVQDSAFGLQFPLPYFKTDYAYDNNGNMLLQFNWNMLNGLWEPGSQAVFAYDASNRLVSYLSQYYYLGDLYDSYKDSFNYTGNNVQFTNNIDYYPDGAGGWLPISLEKDIINSMGVVDTYYLYEATMTGWDTIERDYVVYDADGLAQYGHGFEYLGNGVYNTNPYDMQKWYWEEYDDPTGVVNMQKNGEIVLYPNPVNERLTIRRSNADKASVTIFNMQGMLVYSKTLEGRENVLDLSGMVPGSYAVLVRDAKGSIVHRQVCSKL